MSDTLLYAVTGNPILHSKSPCLFNPVLLRNNKKAHCIRLFAKTAEEAIEGFHVFGLSGMDVTAPFKESIIPFLDVISPEAELIGEVNTIVLKKSKLYGYNTDFYSVSQSLKSAQVELKGVQCVVIGADGAGKAAAYGLVKQGALVTIINRNIEKAEKISKKIGCNYKGFDELEKTIKSSKIIILSLGPEVNTIKHEWINASHIVFDVTYKNSRLLEYSKKQGAFIIDEVEWLLNGAIPAFDYYFGKTPKIERMRRGLSTYNLHEKYNQIALIGFMGTGKSTVGKLLAKQFGFTFYDVDDCIIEKTKKSITEIFAQEGEEYFRKIESEVLNELVDNKQNSIISCGGGIILSKKNRTVLKNKCLNLWLHAPAEVVVNRISDNTTRPLFQNTDNKLEKAKKILKKRMKFYSETADLAINTNNKQPEIIAKELYEEIYTTFYTAR